jgi:hypothetical protein
VIDARLAIPRFPSDPAVADSRGLAHAELPSGSGWGIDLNGHVYVLTWRVITFGLGGQLLLARNHSEATEANPGVRTVTERLTSFTPQLSFNFGSGDGWSYISGGIGPSVWSIVPDGQTPQAADEERLFTYNFGGGARWFTRRHLAVHFDVRWHIVSPGSASTTLPGSPGASFFIIGAGVSVK